MKPSSEQALQFAIMIKAGLPPKDALGYFLPPEMTDPRDIAQVLIQWQRSREVQRATHQLMGKAWQEMSLEEMRDYALDRHYAQMAYFLFSTHYADLQGNDKLKADTARQALEAQRAGTAGQQDALSQFFADINSGKVKLAKPVMPIVKPN
jgi:hypothetical protein